MRAKSIPKEKQYQLVLECRQRGLSDYSWCLEHDIKPGTFQNWVKRLRQTGTYDIPQPSDRTTYTAAPSRQDVVRVELPEEPVKTTETGYDINQESLAAFPHLMELHISNASVLVVNDVDRVLLAQTIHILQGGLSCQRISAGWIQSISYVAAPICVSRSTDSAPLSKISCIWAKI